MVQVPLFAVLLGLTLCILPSHGALAEQFRDDVVYEAARNKLGLIRYCRKNGLLDPAAADQVLLVMVGGVRKLAPEGGSAKEQGDRAEEAGEDGYWDAGRRRDIVSVAKLFRTTPADLCQEWAAETLRAQARKRRRELATIPVAAPIRRVPKATDQAEGGWPSLLSGQGSDAVSALPPPLPERAPFQPSEAAFAAWQRSLPPADNAGAPPSDLTPAETAAARLAAEEAAVEAEEAAQLDDLRLRERPLAAAAPSGDAPTRFEARSPARRGPSERCLMPGCRWPTAQERDYWR